MASALSATVKARTAELAASIQDTDWRSELSALQQGLKEDTGELAHHAKAATQELTHRAKAAAEQLPAAVEGLPGKGAALQARAVEARHQLQAAGKSLGSLGQRLVHSTTELFDQINTAVQAELDQHEDALRGRAPSGRGPAGGGGPRYSRFEADVSAMQRDSGTYCDEPDDAEDYATWHATFDLASRKRDVDALVADNTFMSELQARIVPLIVEYELFWTRYFYRLHKLELRHAQFAALTQRAEQGAGGEEEEVGWGSDEDDDAGAAAAAPPDPAEEQQPVAEEAAASLTTSGVPSVDAPAEVAAEEADEAAEAQQAEGGSGAGAEADEPAAPRARSSEDEGTLVASTASERSEAGGKEPWCVVEERTKQAAPETEAAQHGGEAVADALPDAAAAAAPAKAVMAESTSLSEFALGDDVEDDATGGAKPAAGAEGEDDSDWGEDAADWE